MKQGHRRILGLSLMAHLFGMGVAGTMPKEATGKDVGVSHYNAGANPLFDRGKSQKRHKHNMNNVSHKTRLKHRRAA